MTSAKHCVVIFGETKIPSALTSFCYIKETEQPVLPPKTTLPDAVGYLESSGFTRNDLVPTLQELFLNGFTDIRTFLYDGDGIYLKTLGSIIIYR